MSKNHTPGARRVVPRSRGALSGFALIVLGLWGALIPFVGPYFNFSFTPDDAWHWTSARGWLEVLPGAAAFVAGYLLLSSRSRMTTLVAAWLGIAAGAWFAVGPQLQGVWNIGSPGQPAGTGSGVRVLEVLALFTLLGVVIVYFAATAFGRLSVVSLRDANAAEQREAAAVAEAERERDATAAREREAAAAREREAAAAQERDAAAAQEREAAAARERDAAAATAASGRTTSGQDPTAHDITDNDASRETVRVAPNENHFVGDPRDGAVQDRPGPGAHAAVGTEAQRVPAQPQQGYAQPQQGYAQPQHYDPQSGYPEQTPVAPVEPQPEHESVGRRLFHRR